MCSTSFTVLRRHFPAESKPTSLILGLFSLIIPSSLHLPPFRRLLHSQFFKVFQEHCSTLCSVFNCDFFFFYCKNTCNVYGIFIVTTGKLLWWPRHRPLQEGTAEMCRNDRINLHGCTKFPGFCSNCCDHETANAWRDFSPGFCWLCSSQSQSWRGQKKTSAGSLDGLHQEHSCWLTATWTNLQLI